MYRKFQASMDEWNGGIRVGASFICGKMLGDIFWREVLT